MEQIYPLLSRSRVPSTHKKLLTTMTRKSKQPGGHNPLTYAETKRLKSSGYGTQSTRLTSDSQLPFGHCCLSLSQVSMMCRVNRHFDASSLYICQVLLILLFQLSMHRSKEMPWQLPQAIFTPGRLLYNIY